MTITMDRNKSVTANLVRRYTLTIAVSPSGGGDTSPTQGTYTYDEGEQVAITAIPGSRLAVLQLER